MKKLLTCLLSTFLFISMNAQVVMDIDGNTYKTVKIGEQTWMAENLAATKAPDGSEIVSFPYLGVDDSVKIYGRIYDWANARKACPSGWHLPSDEEWLAMIKYLGGPLEAGGKMKETGTTHWKDPNNAASNESGFSAIPGGFKTAEGAYIDFKRNVAYFWSSSSMDDLRAIGYYVNNSEAIIYRNYKSLTKDRAIAVRCVKD
jgi:uncharacterized protein (TIGR02145 family)